MEKKKTRRRIIKNRIQRVIFFAAILLIIAGVIIRLTPGSVRSAAAAQIAPSDIPQLAALKKYVFSKNGAGKIRANMRKNAANYERDDCIVFLSLSDTLTRAYVVKGTGGNLRTAWKNAEKKAAEIVAEKQYSVVWAKADIVNTAREISTEDFYNEVSASSFDCFYRRGIALDKNFNMAFLEAELNGNGILSYKTSSSPPLLQIKNLNNYLHDYYGQGGLTSIPGRLTSFTTIGFFCDEDGAVYDLYTNGLDYGRRIVDIVDDNYIEPIILNAAHYLYNQLQPDGSFIYGNYPVFDQNIRSYNILRHAGSVWSLINLYRMTGDEELIPQIDAAVNFVLEENIQYKDAETAYVVETKSNEVKLGANGITVVMLSEYMDVFKTDRYTGIVRHLANGILELQDEQGRYYHVLNYPGWSGKQETRTVYYDGEATFALARAYTYTGEQKYLDAAALAVENFIAQNYVKHTDHWVAYSVNEVTKYIPDPRYYEFALRNVHDNLDKINRYARSFQTSLELLMAGWQTYERLLASGIEIQYPQDFKAERFAETIYKRAFHLLNDYSYPEYAMYLKAPHKIADTFFQRNDKYRIRIDDVQHFIGGYYYYFLYYEKIRPYLSDEFILSVNRGNIVN